MRPYAFPRALVALAAAALDLIPGQSGTLGGLTAVVAQSTWEGVGTWSSGNGAVLTGPTFGVPYNNSFIYPPVAGYSFSFTDDGYYEQAQFTWNSNATNHHCIEAVVIWSHGTYEVLSNGSITTDPTVFAADNRIQTQNACNHVSSSIYYYNSPGLYKTWAVSEWRSKTMLRATRLVRWNPLAAHVQDQRLSSRLHVPELQHL
ncbi:hypothetical protein JCM11641_000460 [Rhodosporidiobolus odoratus]